MVNETILGALRSALARGESLKKAMMTLYNAGYKKEEISEAARAVNEPSSIPQTQQPQVAQQPAQQPQQQSLKPTTQIPPSTQQKPAQVQQPQVAQQQIPPQTQQPAQQPIQQVQQPMQQQPPAQNIIQKVSGYGQPPKPGSKTTIIILGFLLLLLLGALITIFLFKEELLNFFNNMFT